MVEEELLNLDQFSEFLSDLFSISKEDPKVLEESENPPPQIDFDLTLNEIIKDMETNTVFITSNSNEEKMERLVNDKTSVNCGRGCQNASGLFTFQSVVGRKISSGLYKSKLQDKKAKVKRSSIVKLIIRSNTDLLFPCEVCPGCKSKFCGSCNICLSGKLWLCRTRICDEITKSEEEFCAKTTKNIRAVCDNLKNNNITTNGMFTQNNNEFCDNLMKNNNATACGMETKNYKKAPRTRKKSSCIKSELDPSVMICYKCGKQPKVPSRSELYKHYATQHYFRDLMLEFGHLESCRQCGLELVHFSDITRVTHFGQKHSEVEKYLPTWARLSRKKKGRTTFKDDGESVGIVAFPEVPHSFDPIGLVRGVDRDLQMSVELDGFKIELVSSEAALLNQIKNVSKLNCISPKTRCNICKKTFPSTEVTLGHVQFEHGMRHCSMEALLTTGYMVKETGKEDTCLGESVRSFGLSDTDRLEALNLVERNTDVRKVVESSSANMGLKVSEAELTRDRRNSMSSGYDSSFSTSSSPTAKRRKSDIHVESIVKMS